ncbi:MAG TPA: hypothetical protein VGI10_22705 [Polyangiaceae bacterium]
MSAEAVALARVAAIDTARAEANQLVVDAQKKERGARLARNSAKPNTPAKELLKLREAHEVAEEQLTAAIRERDSGRAVRRAAEQAVAKAREFDLDCEAEEALRACKAVARDVIALQDQIAALEMKMEPSWLAYLEGSGAWIGEQVNPNVEHEPGRPLLYAQLYREVRRELGEHIPGIDRTATVLGGMIAAMRDVDDARSLEDQARPQKPKHVARLTPLQQDQLYHVCDTFSIFAASHLGVTKGSPTLGVLYAIAGSPRRTGRLVSTANVTPEMLAEIANGLEAALKKAAMPPLPGGAGGPGRPFEQARVTAERAKAYGWVAQAAPIPNPASSMWRELDADPQPSTSL